jgi:glycosyltransferase involved in cell wall biosynthesis
VGVDVELHVLAEKGTTARLRDTPYRLVEHPSWSVLPRLGLSPAMSRGLSRSAKTAEIMHNHSLWMAPNVYPGWAVRGTTCKLVCSPHGTLNPAALERSAWRKRLVWWAGERRVVLGADLLHATAESEFLAMRAVGAKGPVAVVPNGIDVPAVAEEERRAARASVGAGRRRLLYLSRVHPTKGVEDLVRAWAQLSPRFPEWELVVAGTNDLGHATQMHDLAYSLGLERITFPGPIFGVEKTRLYLSAELFVLPSHTENFGIVVAEALASGVPAVVSQGAPWPELESRGCGWWPAIGPGPLTEALALAMSEAPERLASRGAIGREWMREFAWAKAAAQLRSAYEWVVGGGPVPACVRTD